MKKIASFLMMAAVVAFTFASCTKNDEPKKPEEEQNENKDPEKTDPEEEEAKLAIDGKFGEWKDITAIEGQDGILLMKTQTNDKNLYFYLEADADVLVTEKVNYANYLTLVFDCDGDGAQHASYWGGEAGVNYDFHHQIWLMANGSVKLSNWDMTGLTGKGKIEAGVLKLEFAFSRDTNELLKGKKIFFGAYITDQYVEVEEGTEQWLGGELVGRCPTEDSELVLVK